MTLPKLAQMGLYYKLSATLRLTGDRDGLRFLTDLKPQVARGDISMVRVLFQLDQHDFAVRNRLTLGEHRYDLDVPSWEERPRSPHGSGSVAAEIAASVR